MSTELYCSAVPYAIKFLKHEQRLLLSSASPGASASPRDVENPLLDTSEESSAERLADGSAASSEAGFAAGSAAGSTVSFVASSAVGSATDSTAGSAAVSESRRFARFRPCSFKNCQWERVG